MLVAAAASLAFTGVASAQVGAGKTTGSGSVASGNPFAPFQINVNARGIVAGTDVLPAGRVTFRNDEFSFEGDVACYFQSGNVADISGPIVDSKGLDSDNGFYALSVQDNGQDDLVSFNAVEGLPLFCGDAGPPALPLEGGNIQVHPFG